MPAANPIRCEYCGVLHGNHAINCTKPRLEGKMKITVEIDDKEIKYFTTTCVLRVMKGAYGALPDTYDYLDEVLEAGEMYEKLRSKIVSEIFKAEIEGRRVR